VQACLLRLWEAGNERGWMDGCIGLGAVLNASDRKRVAGTVLSVKARERERCEEAYFPRRFYAL